MERVSLTTFMDFINKSGGPKMTVVRQWKNKDDYTPMQDFYKRFRETVANMHENDLPLSTLDDMLKKLTDRKKKTNYPEVVKGYKRWRKAHEMEWFQPATSIWHFEQLQLSINPELGMYIDGTPHLIKLYLKGARLGKTQAGLITNLLVTSRPRSVPKHCVYSVLDARRGRLYSADRDDSLLTTQLECEAQYWCRAVEAL